MICYQEFREALFEATGFKIRHGLRVLYFNLIISGAPASVLCLSSFHWCCDECTFDFLDFFSSFHP